MQPCACPIRSARPSGFTTLRPGRRRRLSGYLSSSDTIRRMRRDQRDLLSGGTVAAPASATTNPSSRTSDYSADLVRHRRDLYAPPESNLRPTGRLDTPFARDSESVRTSVILVWYYN